MQRRLSHVFALWLIGLVCLPLGELQAQRFSLKKLFGSQPKQTEGELRLRSHYVGAGGVMLKDTYLSPLRYGGSSWSYLSEGSRFVRLGQSDATRGKWLRHSMTSLDYGSTLNPAGNASIRLVSLRLDRGLMYRLGRGAWGRLYAGLGVSAAVGAHYSSRNGNNPATAQVDLAVVARLSYSYQLPWRAFPARLRLGSYTNIVGTAFAQDFGENYYELYERGDGYSGSFRFIHPFNAHSLRTMLALDIPILDYATLSLGYRWQIHRRDLNHTQTQLDSHTMYVGFTSYLRSYRGRRLTSDRSTSLPF